MSIRIFLSGYFHQKTKNMSLARNNQILISHNQRFDNVNVETNVALEGVVGDNAFNDWMAISVERLKLIFVCYVRRPSSLIRRIVQETLLVIFLFIFRFHGED